MSRTRKDRQPPRPDWDDDAAWDRYPWWKYPQYLKAKPYVKFWWGRQRNRVKMDLRNGVEPEPTRTRNSVKWDIS